MQNPFTNTAFSMTALTNAMNILPINYGRVENLRERSGTFKKVCQAAFLVQLNFQSIWKENIKLRHS